VDLTEDAANPLPEKPHSGNGAVSAMDFEPPNILDVVAEAMKELSMIRQKERSARPLRIVPQHKIHRPDSFLQEKFAELAKDELHIRMLNARDWLKVATWWLLKVDIRPPHPLG
jgi:hypothetical protein